MKSLVILLIALFIGGTGAIASAQVYQLGTSSVNNMDSPHIDFSQCHPKCVVQVPTHGNPSGAEKEIDLSKNTYFDVVLANGATMKGVILTPHDFIMLQNNIIVAWIGNFSPTTVPQNVDYCALAQFLWDNQTPEFKGKYDINLVIPLYCQDNHIPAIPEFGQVVSIVLAVAIISIIAVSSRTGLKHG